MTEYTPQIAACLTGFVQPFLTRDDVVVRVDDTIDDIAHFDRRNAQIAIKLAAVVGAQRAAEADVLLTNQRLIGVLAHEIGHADHTPERRIDPEIAEWAALLEEPRIERIIAADFPDLREPLTVSAAATVLPARVRTVGDALAAFILLGGRVAAGILDETAVAEALAAARSTLPAVDATRVQNLIAIAVAAPDLDRTVVECAEQIAAIARAYQARPPQPTCRTSNAGDVRAAPEPLRGAGSRSSAPLGEAYIRDATADERASVRHISAGRAERAAVDARHSKRGTGAPPGSARMAELVRADAQASLGLTRTAMPWRRRHPTAEDGSIELGLILDCSSSMASQRDAAASAAWVLRHAITDGLGRTCTWTFADHAGELPVEDPDRIVVPAVGPSTTALTEAIDHYQSWTAGHQQRMLVIVSDGALAGASPTAQLMRLQSEGVSVIGLVPDLEARLQLTEHLPDGAIVEILVDNLLDRLADHALQPSRPAI